MHGKEWVEGSTKMGKSKLRQPGWAKEKKALFLLLPSHRRCVGARCSVGPAVWFCVPVERLHLLHDCYTIIIRSPLGAKNESDHFCTEHLELVAAVWRNCLGSLATSTWGTLRPIKNYTHSCSESLNSWMMTQCGVVCTYIIRWCVCVTDLMAQCAKMDSRGFHLFACIPFWYHLPWLFFICSVPQQWNIECCPWEFPPTLPLHLPCMIPSSWMPSIPFHLPTLSSCNVLHLWASKGCEYLKVLPKTLVLSCRDFASVMHSNSSSPCSRILPWTLGEQLSFLCWPP